MKTTKRKNSQRDDRVSFIKRRKLLKEHVVKVSLPGILQTNTESFREEIDNLVVYISKIKNRGSLVLNRFLLHCFDNNLELPDFTEQNFYRKALLFNEEDITNSSFQTLKDVWVDGFSNFPKIKKLERASLAVNYAAKELKTSVLNSLVVPFFKRQQYVIKQFIESNNIPKKSMHVIKCHINGILCKETATPLIQPFINNQ